MVVPILILTAAGEVTYTWVVGDTFFLSQTRATSYIHVIKYGGVGPRCSKSPPFFPDRSEADDLIWSFFLGSIFRSADNSVLDFKFQEFNKILWVRDSCDSSWCLSLSPLNLRKRLQIIAMNSIFAIIIYFTSKCIITRL